MKILTFIVAMAVAAIPACAADDHLHPEESSWDRGSWIHAKDDWSQRQDEYVAILQAAMPQAFAADVRVRYVGETYGYPEDATGLKQDGAGFRVFSLQSSVWLWNYTPDGIAQAKEENERLKPAHIEDVKISTCEKPIDAALADKIVTAWKDMLLDARYVENPNGGADGSTDHFAMVLNNQVISAQIWTPQVGTRPRLLEEITYDMAQFCQSNDPQKAQKLGSDVDALLGRFQSERR